MCVTPRDHIEIYAIKLVMASEILTTISWRQEITVKAYTAAHPFWLESQAKAGCPSYWDVCAVAPELTPILNFVLTSHHQ